MELQAQDKLLESTRWDVYGVVDGYNNEKGQKNAQALQETGSNVHYLSKKYIIV